MRFGDRLEVALSPDPQVLDALVPSFILQPLVENAIRYGAAKQSTPTKVQVDAWREDGRVRLRVRDDGPGLPENWSLQDHAGIGLSNTRERLQQLYGTAHHSFAITSEPGGGVCVELSLPFHRA
jgi:two-component system, LytTR family, sensor kinase